MPSIALIGNVDFDRFIKTRKKNIFNSIGDIFIERVNNENIHRFFKKFKFNKLTSVTIYNCGKVNLNFLDFLTVSELTYLYIENCTTISPEHLKKYNFLSLSEFYIGYNSPNILFLKELNASTLKDIIIYNKKISNISPLLYCSFPELRKIIINSNKLKNILPLFLANFPKLETVIFDNSVICNKFYDLSYKKYVKTKKYKIDILFAGRMIKNMDLLELVTSYIYKIHERLLINKVKEKINKLNINPFTDI